MGTLTGITAPQGVGDPRYFRDELDKNESLRKLLLLDNPVVQPIMSRILGLSEEDDANGRKFTSVKYYLLWVMGVEDISKINIVLLSIITEAIRLTSIYTSTMYGDVADLYSRCSVDMSFAAAVERFQEATFSNKEPVLTPIISATTQITMSIVYRSVVKNIGMLLNRRERENPDGRKSSLKSKFEHALNLYPDLWNLTSSDPPERFLAKVFKAGYPLLKFDVHHGFILDQRVKNRLPDNDIDLTRILSCICTYQYGGAYKTTYLVGMAELLNGLATDSANNVVTLYNFQVDKDLVQPPLFKGEEFTKFAASVEGYMNMEMSNSDRYVNHSLEEYSELLVQSVAKYLVNAKAGISKSLQTGLVRAHAMKLQIAEVLNETRKPLKCVPEDTNSNTNVYWAAYAADGYKLFNTLPADVRVRKSVHNGCMDLSGEVLALLPLKTGIVAKAYLSTNDSSNFGVVLNLPQWRGYEENKKNRVLGFDVILQLGKLTSSFGFYTNMNSFEKLYNANEEYERKEYGVQWTTFKKSKGMYQSTLSMVLGKINSMLPFLFVGTNHQRMLNLSFGTTFNDSKWCGESPDFKEAVHVFERRLEGLLGRPVSVRKFFDRFSVGKYTGFSILTDIIQNKSVTFMDSEDNVTNETLGEVYVTVPIVSSTKPNSTVPTFETVNKTNEDRQRLLAELSNSPAVSSTHMSFYTDKPMSDEHILNGVTVALVRGIVVKRTVTTDSWVGDLLGLKDQYSSYYISFTVLNDKTCSARVSQASAFLKDLSNETIVSTVRSIVEENPISMLSSPVVAFDVDMSALKFNTGVAWTINDFKLR